MLVTFELLSIFLLKNAHSVPIPQPQTSNQSPQLQKWHQSSMLQEQNKLIIEKIIVLQCYITTIQRKPLWTKNIYYVKGHLYITDISVSVAKVIVCILQPCTQRGRKKNMRNFFCKCLPIRYSSFYSTLNCEERVWQSLVIRDCQSDILLSFILSFMAHYENMFCVNLMNNEMSTGDFH